MLIGLVADGKGTFPNLPLMKISAWHKAQGHTVEFVESPLKHYDRVYVSKVFGDEYTELPAYFFNADEVYEGGTGLAISVVNGREVFNKDKHSNLPPEIEHIYPDYSLYPELTKNKAFGFLTRGCPNNCPFCIVSKKEGLFSVKVADLSEWWNGQKEIVLLDANILACREHIALLQQLKDSGATVDYCQGLDARFINPDNAALLSQIKTKMFHFAFDFIENEKRIVKGLELFKQYVSFDPRRAIVYMLTNYDTDFRDDWHRLTLIRALGYTPDVRIYRKTSLPKPHILRDFQHWANNRFIYHSCDFWEFVPRKDGKPIKEIYPDAFASVQARSE